MHPYSRALFGARADFSLNSLANFCFLTQPQEACSHCTEAGLECIPISASLPCERCWILYRHTCSLLDLHRWNELFLELCSMAILSFDHPRESFLFSGAPILAAYPFFSHYPRFAALARSQLRHHASLVRKFLPPY